MPGGDPGPLARVRLAFADPLVPGRLMRRYKRFLAEVALESGEVVTAHCPNSGSMLTCIEDGAPVRLSPSSDPRRRTRFTWEMIRLAPGWIGVNTMIPNRLAALAAQRQALPLFQGVTAVRREVKVGQHSRIDLALETGEGPLMVEVKNVTLVQGGQARFPDSVTARGAKHLEELMRVKAQGARAAMLYVIQRPDARDFAPADDIDPTYARLYWQAREAGVEVAAVEARVTPEAIALQKEIPLAPRLG